MALESSGMKLFLIVQVIGFLALTQMKDVQLK
jgi:hypothetical protein